jgi:hypothetical protein
VLKLLNKKLLVAMVVPALMAVLQSAHAEGAAAGVVIITSGKVTASGRELSRGAKIFSGDDIRTGDNSSIQIRFTDKGLVSLGPKADYKVNSYEYSGPNDKQANSTSTLVKGRMLALTGAITKENPKGYKVKTKLSTIGVTGTELSTTMTRTFQILEVFHGTVECRSFNGTTVAVGDNAPFSNAMISEGNPTPVGFSEAPAIFEEPEEATEEEATQLTYDTLNQNSFFTSFEMGLDNEYDAHDLEELSDSFLEEDVAEELP